MRHTLLLAALFCIFGCSLATGNNPDSLAYMEDNSPIDPILAEDIGEMLLVGFQGTTFDSTDHIWRDLTHFHVGSVILFDYDCPTGHRGRNIQSPEQVKKLCQQLREISPSVLIGIDQEGGSVSRLHPRYGFPKTESAKQTAIEGSRSVKNNAIRTAKMLSELGINLNFAPDADVDINPNCPVIGQMGRSFSSSPERVTECCKIWIDEQRKEGVVSCLKHFPGHGSAKHDTHLGLVDVSRTWNNTELDPYRTLAKEVPMVMTAHVINERLDPSGLPASLSSSITSYLRDSIGFTGVIVTDDLAMGAIVDHYSFEKAIEMAVMAGADMLCLSNNGKKYNPEQVPTAFRVINHLVKEGTVSAERIHESAERIRAIKSSLNSSEK